MRAERAHRIEIVPGSRPVRVSRDGVVLAESARPVLLHEGRLPTRYYFPRSDVRMELLEPSDHTTQCPFKGTASYWSVNVGGETLENFVWCYEDPIDEAAGIKGLLAFYNEKVDLEVDGEKI